MVLGTGLPAKPLPVLVVIERLWAVRTLLARRGILGSS